MLAIGVAASVFGEGSWQSAMTVGCRNCYSFSSCISLAVSLTGFLLLISIVIDKHVSSTRKSSHMTKKIAIAFAHCSLSLLLFLFWVIASGWPQVNTYLSHSTIATEASRLAPTCAFIFRRRAVPHVIHMDDCVTFAGSLKGKMQTKNVASVCQWGNCA